MPRPRQQRATGSTRAVLVAVVLLAMLSLCLARIVVDAAAASSSLGPPWEKGAVATAVDEVEQEATVAGKRGAVVHERVGMEVSINDYPDSRANSRHNPTHP